MLGTYISYTSWKEDGTAPEIKIEEGTLTLSVKDPEDRLLEGVTARDSKDGDVTDSIVVESVYGISEDGLVNVRYAAFDKAGNVAVAERYVSYEDYEKPVIQLEKPLVFEYGKNIDVFGCVSAYDVFDGDITRRIKATMVSENGDISEEGMHEVQFRVTNSVGDSAVLVLPVEVCPSDEYNAQLTLSDWLIYLPVGEKFDPEKYPVHLFTSYEEFDLTKEIPDGLVFDITNEVDTSKAGVYSVTYKAMMETGNRSYIAKTRLVVVVEGGNANG